MSAENPTDRKARIKLLRAELALLTKAERAESRGRAMKTAALLVTVRDTAHDMHTHGISFGKIARALNVSDQTAKAYVKQGAPDSAAHIIWSWRHGYKTGNPVKNPDYGAVIADWLDRICT